MATVFGCFPMQTVLWPYAPIRTTGVINRVRVYHATSLSIVWFAVKYFLRSKFFHRMSTFYKQQEWTLIHCSCYGVWFDLVELPWMEMEV